jgi:hypothetical protein
LQLGVASNGYAHERKKVMLRNLGISLMFLGLLAAGMDGFRVRERVRTAAPSTTGTGSEGGVHTAENGQILFPR